MKEFLAQTGGRYTYSDDFLNLQELALAVSSIFSDCGDLIISGCKLEGGRLTAGSVYLNGKIRNVPETPISGDRAYIYEANRIENIDYVTGGSKEGRAVYDVRVEQSELTGVTDPVTLQAPRYITASANNDYSLAVKFFGRYCLSTVPGMGEQTVPNDVSFAGNVTFGGQILFPQGIHLGNEFDKNVLMAEDGGVTLRTLFGADGDTRFLFGSDGLFNIVNGGNSVLKVTTAGLQVAGRMSVPISLLGRISILENHIYQSSTNANAPLNINMLGYNGGTSQFRDTVIGDGKDKALVYVEGATSSVRISARTGILSGDLSVYEVLGSTNKAASLSFKNADGTLNALVGYNGSADGVFRIKAQNRVVEVDGTYLDVKGEIKEDGAFLKDKYALKSDIVSAVAPLPTLTNIYTKTETDNKFAQKANGLSQFVTGSNTKAALRSQIEAAGLSDLDGYARKSNYLADMATTEAEKAQIRQNIGALGAGDYQPRIGDTGWVNGSSQFPGEVKARQIGNIVYVVGHLRFDGLNQNNVVIFTIPNAVDAPMQTIYVDMNNGYVALVHTVPGSRGVVYDQGTLVQGRPVYFHLIYFV